MSVKSGTFPVAALRERLSARPGNTLEHPEAHTLRESAVLVPLVEKAEGPAVVLTKRPLHLKHHAGQISFPGGAREPADASLLETALREANEELGIPPERVDVLGRLHEIPTVTDFRIVPFVGVLGEQVTLRPSPAEVAEVLEVPLSHLRRPEVLRIEKRTYRGYPDHLHFYDFGEHVIWGATARILYDLLHLTADL